MRSNHTGISATATHSALLGVLLTFAGSLWYPEYAEPARRLAVDALQDQQLAGLLMWIPGGLVHAGAALVLIARGLGASKSGQAHALP